MLRKLITFKIVSLLVFPQFIYAQDIKLNEYEKKIKNNFSIKNVVDKVGHRDVEKNLREFVQKTRPNRYTGSVGNKKAHEYLINFLNSKKNSNTTLVENDFKTSEGLMGKNIIWSKKGLSQNTEKVILLTHIDSILKDKGKTLSAGEMPGADSNGSSVAILMSMISLFNELDLPKTIEVVFLDAQELDNQGIKHYLSHHLVDPKKDFIINFSSIGHDSKKIDKLQIFNNMKMYYSPSSNESQNAFAQKLIELGRVNYPQIQFSAQIKTRGIFNDPIDVAWGLGLNGLLVSHDRENDLNPRIYTSNDFPETINFNTLFFVYKAMANAVLALNYDIVNK